MAKGNGITLHLNSPPLLGQVFLLGNFGLAKVLLPNRTEGWVVTQA